MTALEFHLRTAVAHRFVRFAHRFMDIAVWLAPSLDGPAVQSSQQRR
jgi:hypothetical protein